MSLVASILDPSGTFTVQGTMGRGSLDLLWFGHLDHHDVLHGLDPGEGEDEASGRVRLVVLRIDLVRDLCKNIFQFSGPGVNNDIVDYSDEYAVGAHDGFSNEFIDPDGGHAYPSFLDRVNISLTDRL